MTPLHKMLTDRRGVSALEFVLVMPLLAFIMFAVADYGNALQQILRLESAARAGAQVALTAPGNTDGIRAAVLNNLSGWSAAPNCSNGVGNGVCVTTRTWCQCSPATTANINPANAVSCDSGDTTTPVCTTQNPLSQFVSITVTRPYAWLQIVPFETLRGNVELRVL